MREWHSPESYAFSKTGQLKLPVRHVFPPETREIPQSGADLASDWTSCHRGNAGPCRDDMTDREQQPPTIPTLSRQPHESPSAYGFPRRTDIRVPEAAREAGCGFP